MKYYVLMLLNNNQHPIFEVEAKDKRHAIKLFNHKHRSSFGDINFIEFESKKAYEDYCLVVDRLNPKPKTMQDLFREIYGPVMQDLMVQTPIYWTTIKNVK